MFHMKDPAAIKTVLDADLLLESILSNKLYNEKEKIELTEKALVCFAENGIIEKGEIKSKGSGRYSFTYSNGICKSIMIGGFSPDKDSFG